MKFFKINLSVFPFKINDVIYMISLLSSGHSFGYFIMERSSKFQNNLLIFWIFYHSYPLIIDVYLSPLLSIWKFIHLVNFFR